MSDKITISELKKIDFSIEVITLHDELETYDGEEADQYFKSLSQGSVILSSGDIKIEFDYIAEGGKESYIDAHNFEIEIDDADIEISGATVVCDDQEEHEADNEELRDVLNSNELNNWIDAVRKDLPKPEIENIDINEGSKMETVIVERDNGQSIKFSGELVAKSCSSANNSSPDYSGSTGRWTEMKLYKTAGGKFICSQVERTQWQGERDEHLAKVCENEVEVAEFFGQGWIAKDLYFNAQIENVVIVD